MPEPAEAITDCDIEGVVRDSASVEDGMAQLIRHCDVSWPHDVWERIGGLDWGGDLRYLTEWLGAVIQQEPPAAEVKAYWFGLFNPTLETGEPTCGLYISGSTRYSETDLDMEWACWDDDSYLPEARYARSTALEGIYRLLSESGEPDLAAAGEYTLCLGYAALAVRAACRSADPALLARGCERPVVVGFDSGDWIVLGVATPHGFVACASPTEPV